MLCNHRPLSLSALLVKLSEHSRELCTILWTVPVVASFLSPIPDLRLYSTFRRPDITRYKLADASFRSGMQLGVDLKHIGNICERHSPHPASFFPQSLRVFFTQVVLKAAPSPPVQRQEKRTP